MTSYFGSAASRWNKRRRSPVSCCCGWWESRTRRRRRIFTDKHVCLSNIVALTIRWRSSINKFNDRDKLITQFLMHLRPRRRSALTTSCQAFFILETILASESAPFEYYLFSNNVDMKSDYTSIASDAAISCSICIILASRVVSVSSWQLTSSMSSNYCRLLVVDLCTFSSRTWNLFRR